MVEMISLSEESKLWVYQADRELAELEITQMQEDIRRFADRWVSHARDLKSYGNIFHRRFLVLMVDESQAPASGCSIDASVHFIESLGRKYQVDFFNRTNFAYLDDDEVRTISMHELKQAFEKGTITHKTLMFDNLVNNKGAFIQSWLKPLSDSWHLQFI